MLLIKDLLNFIKDIYHNRKLLLNLVDNDLKGRYSGSMFGVIWVFVQPLVTILVFWFVFQLGFKNPPTASK